MTYLIISILASVSVSVLLKIARRNNIDIAQAVAFNYPVAVLLSIFLLKPDFHEIKIQSSWWLFGSLGILLPLIFIMMGRAVQTAGIVKSDAAQRLSLLITLMVAFLMWHEPASWLKLAGVGLAFIALLLLLQKKQITTNSNANLINTDNKKSNFYLLLVWLGYGVIDLLFKLISKTSGNTFSTTLTLSFIIAAILIFAWLFIQKTTFNTRSLLSGILLGILNFTNIYTYIEAHKHLGDSPSVVFTGMNIGVIALGTMTGVIVFEEKLNKLNYLGIGLAILAIVLLFIQL